MEFNPPNGVDAGSEPKYGRTASNGALERLESRFDAVFHLVPEGRDSHTKVTGPSLTRWTSIAA